MVFSRRNKGCARQERKMRAKINETEIIISDNNNKYHLRASFKYVGLQSPYNEEIKEAAKALGGEWKPGARMWAFPWAQALEVAEAFAAIRIPGYTLTIDEDVAYEIGLIE